MPRVEMSFGWEIHGENSGKHTGNMANDRKTMGKSWKNMTNPQGNQGLPSGNDKHEYGTWPFIVFFPLNMLNFHGDVNLPEGNGIHMGHIF